MRKRQRNPVVITNVFHLAKVGVVGSHPITRSKFSYINSLLRSPYFGYAPAFMQVLPLLSTFDHLSLHK